jgi:hypothetical protein
MAKALDLQTPVRGGIVVPRGVWVMAAEEKQCDECGSMFIAAQSAMSCLCAECARHLYDYPACAHRFSEGRCGLCGWDGSVSAFLASQRDR